MHEVKKYTTHLTDLRKDQSVSISGNFYGTKEIWLNCYKGPLAGSVIITADEAIRLAKMLYKIAYDMGYKNERENVK